MEWQTVESFMEKALYDPDTGYYSRNIRTVGKRGDFATAATLHPILGLAISRWIRQRRSEFPVQDVIELGAGNGELAENILHSLGFWQRWRIRYHIVETSPYLQELQKKRLGSRAIWHSTPLAALQTCHGRALIFSNECLDAFPCQQWVSQNGDWERIEVRPNSPIEIRSVPATPPSTSIFPIECEEAQHVETQESIERWMSEWAPHWNQGAMLTIDYGDLAESLYHRRPHGSLRAYYHHQLFEGMDVFERPGKQDITCDVNFTDLQIWGQQHGLRPHSLSTQEAFLRKWCPHKCEDLTDGALDTLLASDGAGSAFKVLEQVKT